MNELCTEACQATSFMVVVKTRGFTICDIEWNGNKRWQEYVCHDTKNTPASARAAKI